MPHILQGVPGNGFGCRLEPPIVDFVLDSCFVATLFYGTLEIPNSIIAREWRIVSSIVQQRYHRRMKQHPHSLDPACFSCVGADHSGSEEVSDVVAAVDGNVRSEPNEPYAMPMRAGTRCRNSD